MAERKERHWVQVVPPISLSENGKALLTICLMFCYGVKSPLFSVYKDVVKDGAAVVKRMDAVCSPKPTGSVNQFPYQPNDILLLGGSAGSLINVIHSCRGDVLD